MHFTYASACFSSAFGPLKGSCGAKGEEEEDNGSRHYLLLSCRLSVRPHTLWPSQIWMRKWMYLHTGTHARPFSIASLMHADEWGVLGGTGGTRGAWNADTFDAGRKKSRTSTHSHTHTAALWADISLLSKWSRTGTILHIRGQTWISVFSCRSLS